MRLLALFAVLLVLAPSAQAATPQGITAIDERIGQVHDALAAANQTHGEREEFEAAQVELGRSGVALTNGASIVAQSNLLRAYAALETGRTKAQAQAHGAEDPDQAVVDRAHALAQRADGNVSSLRSDLAQAPQAGLEPVALDGLLAVGHHVLQVIDLLDQHRLHQRTWDQGEEREEVSRGLISTAASAALATDIATDLQRLTAQARAQASVSDVVPPETLEQASQQRVDWVKGHGSMPNQEGRDRFLSLHESGEHLLALAAFTLWYQDVAFNRISTEAQRGGDVEPLEVGQQALAEARGPVEAWHEELGTASGTAQGALASAQFTLDRAEGVSDRHANQSGAYATSLAHRAVEHTGILVEVFTGELHPPGQPLPSPGASSSQERERSAPVPALIGIGAVLLAAVAAGRGRRPG